MKTKALQLLIILCILSLAGCSSIPLPERGVVKRDGRTYVLEQPTVMGMRMGKPRWKAVPSRTDKLRDTLQKPAIYTLWVCLPLGFALTALMLWGTASPAIMKRVGVGACVCLTMSVLAGMWLLATYYLIVAVPLVAIALYFGYKKTKGKRLTLAGAEDNVER